MSKRRSSERGAGETSGRASKLQCPGISGSNAKRAGPFILGKEATSVCSSPKSMKIVACQKRLCGWDCISCAIFCELFLRVSVQEIRKEVCVCVSVKVAGCLCVCIYAWDKNVKNFADPHDIGQKGLRLLEQGYFFPSGRCISLPCSQTCMFFYYTIQLQSAKENITLGVLMGTCICSL